MRSYFILAILALPLGACASLRPQPDPATATAECRHLQSPEGKPLRFCEQGSRLVIDDQSIDRDPGIDKKRLIDDAEFLADMIQQLPKDPPPSTKPGKKPNGKPTVAAVCTMADPGYLTISVKDIKRLMQLSAERAAAATAPARNAEVAAIEQ